MLRDSFRTPDASDRATLFNEPHVSQHILAINGDFAWIRLGVSESLFRWIFGQPGLPVYIVSLFTSRLGE